MKVYIYREASDYDSFNAELILVYEKKEDAVAFLKSRVENSFGEPWERCVKIVEEADGAIWPTYVEYPTGDGYDFYSVTQYTVKGGKE